ncbi:MAG: hypothetical protein H6Q14_2951 [Bacteroidetes bacterium]|nr:hypothetical protein [Bacteroidota bacterium]
MKIILFVHSMKGVDSFLSIFNRNRIAALLFAIILE